jgi:hypothetical protein
MFCNIQFNQRGIRDARRRRKIDTTDREKRRNPRQSLSPQHVLTFRSINRPPARRDSSDDLEQKQIERVSDALREVPGLSVVQTGTPGQLPFLRAA